jgi:hypothetical protein
MIQRGRQWLDEQAAALSEKPFGCLVGLFVSRMFHGAGDTDAGELDLGVGVILALLAMPGLLVSLLMFEKYGSFIRYLRGMGAFDPFSDTISDEYFFIVLSACVTGAAALWRWDAVFLDRRDYINLVPLPLSLRDIFCANLCAIVSLAVVFTAVANAASVVLFPIAVVGSQNSLAVLLKFAGGHAMAVFSVSAFSFFAVFGLAGLLSAILPPRFLRRVALSMRFVAAVVLLVLLGTSFTVPDLLRTLPVKLAHTLALLPPVSFLGIALAVWGRAADGMGQRMLSGALMAMVPCVVTAFLAYAVSFRRSFIRLPELPDIGPLPRISFSFSPLAWFHRATFGSWSERACYQFVARSLLRSDAHLQVLSCSFAVGLVVSAETLASSFTVHSGRNAVMPPVEFLCIPFILSYCTLVGVRFAFEVPLDLRANWIFRLWLDSERYDARSVARHVLLAFCVFWLVPIIFAITAWRFGWSIALLHTAMWAACTGVFVEILLIRFRKMPFTCPYPAFHSQSSMIVLAYAFGFLLFSSYLPRLDMWSLQHPIRAVFLVPLFAIALGALRWYRKQMLDMDKHLIFENTSATGFS